MKNLLYLNYSMLVFLFLVAVLGINSALNNYRRYGFSYEVTTTIEGVESTRTVTLTENLGGGLILMGLFWLVLVDTAKLRTMDGRPPTKKEAPKYDES